MRIDVVTIFPEYLDPLRAALLGRAKQTAVFMHPLPANRGQEVSGTVVDGRHSVVSEQAANRLPAEQAIIGAAMSSAASNVRCAVRPMCAASMRVACSSSAQVGSSRRRAIS